VFALLGVDQPPELTGAPLYGLARAGAAARR
jgi:hypothetical protein